ncbi:MAG: dTMP kinase [Desulfosoma sp.]
MRTHEPFVRGVFLSVEGIDGSGKSTILDHVRRWIEGLGHKVRVIREPGGTRLGERIRNLLLEPRLSPIAPWAETCLYAASQAQHVFETIVPCLEQGVWILADRFRDATVAYQGWGRGLGAERVQDLQKVVLGSLFPDITVLLDCEVTVAWRRLSQRSVTRDRMEQEGLTFLEKVRHGYLDLARRDPKRFIVIDAAQDLPKVIEDVMTALEATRPKVEEDFRSRK